MRFFSAIVVSSERGERVLGGAREGGPVLGDVRIVPQERLPLAGRPPLERLEGVPVGEPRAVRVPLRLAAAPEVVVREGEVGVEEERARELEGGAVRRRPARGRWMP